MAQKWPLFGGLFRSQKPKSRSQDKSETEKVTCIFYFLLKSTHQKLSDAPKMVKIGYREARLRVEPNLAIFELF